MQVSIKPIGKDLQMNIDLYRRSIIGGLEVEAEKIEELFMRSTSTFRQGKHKPTIKRTKVKQIGYDREILVGALTNTEGNSILSMINHGTNPRGWYTASPKGPMRYFTGYSAATGKSRALKPRRSKRSGNVRVTRYVKNHSIEARHIDKAIAKRRMGYFKKTMQTRMKKRAKEHWR